MDFSIPINFRKFEIETIKNNPTNSIWKINICCKTDIKMNKDITNKLIKNGIVEIIKEEVKKFIRLEENHIKDLIEEYSKYDVETMQSIEHFSYSVGFFDDLCFSILFNKINFSIEELLDIIDNLKLKQ